MTTSRILAIIGGGLFGLSIGGVAAVVLTSQAKAFLFAGLGIGLGLGCVVAALIPSAR